MSGVMSEIEYVQKQEKAAGLQYSYVSHDAVSAKLHPLLVSYGIMAIPTVTGWAVNGNRTEVDISMDFINIDDPADRHTITGFGFGIDKQDKGPGKAISYACKMLMLKTFMLETGEDPEKDNIDHEPEYISDEQAQIILNMISETGTDIEKFCAFMKIDAVVHLPAGMYQKALAALEMKKKVIDKEEQNPLEAG
jgi:hypothetical protein